MGLRASIVAASLVLLASTTAAAAPKRELKPAQRVAVVGDTKVDVGSDQTFSITDGGWIYLDKAPLVRAGGLDPQMTEYAHHLTRDHVTVAKGQKPVPHQKIVFSYDEGLAETGERIDADALADALGIPAIRNRVDLHALADGVKVGQEQYGDVMITWGPLGFHDDNHRWVEGHVGRP